MRALWLVMAAAVSQAGALSMDKFDYKDSAALRQAWLGQGEAKAPELSMGGDMVRAAELICNFSNLKDWRLSWDHDVTLDLSESQQICITLKSPDAAAISQAVIYLKSGAGWYRFPAFSVGPSWETKVLSKEQAVTEDQPSSWSKIDRIRLSFMPGTPRRDTRVEVSDISARSGWPLSYLGSVGGYADFAAAEKGLKALAKGEPCEKDIE
jgi:hypothetical protein